MLGAETRKLCYRKDDRAMCRIYDCPENQPTIVQDLLNIYNLITIVNVASVFAFCFFENESS